MNAWLLLILAGLCEIGWPLGLKWAQSGLWRLPGFIMAGVCMLVSGALLFGDPVQPLRLAGIALIVAGVALLKLA